MQRIRELLSLLATAWHIWRESGTPADLEIHEYERAWDARPENVIVLAPRQTGADRNALHFRDPRRMH